MGQPPQFVITRKLIRGFFKEKLTKNQGKEVKSKYSEMLECWATHGLSSLKCEEISQKYDLALEMMNENSKLKIDNKNLHEYVIGQLNRIVYPKNLKGDHHDYYTGLKLSVSSIYDGVKMVKDPKKFKPK